MHPAAVGKPETVEDGVTIAVEPSGELLPVLVVEDDAGLNRLIQKTLQKAGFATRGALSGAEAIAAVTGDRDLLLLLDYSLPDMNARELVETLRAEGCAAPFVVMTGYGDERIAVEMMKLNASDYLVKDAYLIQTLPMVIGEVIRKILMERHLDETREALLKSEERYRMFVEMSSEGVWRCDVIPPVSLALDEQELAAAILSRARLAECNNAYLRQFGHESAERALGTPLSDLLTGTHEEKMALVLQIIRAGGRTSSLETMDKLRDGRTLYTLSNIVGIEENGCCVCIWGTTRDVTDRHRAAEELQESKLFLLSTLDGISASIAILDENGVILAVNKVWRAFALANGGDAAACCEGANYLETADRARGEGAWEAVAFAAGIRAVLHGALDRFDLEYSCHSPNEQRWFIGRVTPFPGDGPRRVIVAHENITGHRRADEELRRLGTAIEHAAEAVVITDAEGTTRYVNPAIETMFGHPRAAVLGVPIAGIVNDGDGRLAQILRETMAGGSVWSGRINGRHINGTDLAIEATASPVRDDVGRTSEVVIILRDITKESNLEVQLRRTQKLEAIGTLAGGIAHDFNNILSSIIGYTQMAMANIPPDGQAAQDLGQVVAAGHRAVDLVRQILTFGRRQEQPQQPLRLDLLAREALNLLRASIPATIEMRSEIAGNCDYVMGDHSQLHQVIVNLCTNAYHAMEKDGGLLSFSIEPVTVDARQAESMPNLRPGAWLRMTVRDTGCGMDQATLERAFDPFFTTKPQGKGTGLGLSIVHGIVKSHGGAIDMQSEPGKGTTVRVWLSTVKMSAQETGVSPDAPLVGHGERILFVDDEEMLVKLGERVLSGLGYAVTAFSDPNRAFDAFSADPVAFDLMITDHTMPFCTGLELAARAHAIRPDFPVILATGLSTALSEEDTAAAGVAEVLGKPVTSYVLAKSTGRVLAAARAAALRSSAGEI